MRTLNKGSGRARAVGAAEVVDNLDGSARCSHAKYRLAARTIEISIHPEHHRTSRSPRYAGAQLRVNAGVNRVAVGRKTRVQAVRSHSIEVPICPLNWRRD